MHYVMGRYNGSQRRAARTARFWRSSGRYESRRDPLTTVRPRMRELAQTRVRFGYRRLLVMMPREGWAVGQHRVERLDTAEGLARRRQRPWRQATAGHREQRRPAGAHNEIWSMDFGADQLADGRRFRTLTVIDLFPRECLAIDVGHGLRGRDVVATRERLRFARGLPQRLYGDHGSEFRPRGDGSVGVHERRPPRLQPSRQADGQCRHRIVQRPVPGRMSDRGLGGVSGRREAEDRRVSVGLR
jgi:putative transposase